MLCLLHALPGRRLQYPARHVYFMQSKGVLAPPAQSEVHCHTALPSHICTVPSHQILRIPAASRLCSCFGASLQITEIVLSFTEAGSSPWTAT